MKRAGGDEGIFYSFTLLLAFLFIYLSLLQLCFLKLNNNKNKLKKKLLSHCCSSIATWKIDQIQLMSYFFFSTIDELSIRSRCYWQIDELSISLAVLGVIVGFGLNQGHISLLI